MPDMSKEVQIQRQHESPYESTHRYYAILLWDLQEVVLKFFELWQAHGKDARGSLRQDKEDYKRVRGNQ